MCAGTRLVLEKSGVPAVEIQGISFCCQMQGSVMVDADGVALRNPMGYMDSRAVRQIDEGLHYGLFRIAGCNALRLFNWLRITECPATPKDPVWKYLWVKQNEPEVYANTYKWLDVKDYLVHRCTGNFCMTPDSANVTFLYDTRPGRPGWHEGLCKTVGVNMDHLPEVRQSTDMVGGLTEKAASEMGLVPGTPVFGGGGDVSLISIGAGCLDLYDTNIYVGTSGWVSSCVDTRMVDIQNFIASIRGAIPSYYNYIADRKPRACASNGSATIALDEIGMYLQARHICETQAGMPACTKFQQRGQRIGARRRRHIFTPWLQVTGRRAKIRTRGRCF